jgi:hypothetical protein
MNLMGNTVFQLGLLAAVMLMLCAGAAASPYPSWENGPPHDDSFFPIAVWLQDTKLAKEYAAIGVNTYVALWHGPTDEQLAQLREAGVKAICDQDSRSLKFRDDPTIIGWMHGDEPDNAQADGKGGWGPATPAEEIIADYRRIQATDPTRPVLLNVGQQVANDEWYGRGCEVTAYREYAKACDVISYDVYPVVGIDKPDGENYLWYVAKGVDRLRRWSGDQKLVWNCIETTHISEPEKKATPHQVKAEVWMSLVHGSMGIIYFCHQFKPTEIDAGLLADKEMAAAVKGINEQIRSLAPVLNSPTIEDGAVVTTSNPLVPIDLMVKQYGGATYVFAVGMRNAEASGRFRLPGLVDGTAEVIGEGRTIEVSGREFRDDFKPYDVHIYKIK